MFSILLQYYNYGDIMVDKKAITLAEWVVRDIIGRPKNFSQRIQELVIKGHMYEIQKEK